MTIVSASGKSPRVGPALAAMVLPLLVLASAARTGDDLFTEEVIKNLAPWCLVSVKRRAEGPTAPVDKVAAELCALAAEQDSRSAARNAPGAISASDLGVQPGVSSTPAPPAPALAPAA